MESTAFVEKCILECGGSNGRFQKVFGTLLAFTFGIQSVFVYAFSFFELMPALTCVDSITLSRSSCLKE